MLHFIKYKFDDIALLGFKLKSYIDYFFITLEFYKEHDKINCKNFLSGVGQETFCKSLFHKSQFLLVENSNRLCEQLV